MSLSSSVQRNLQTTSSQTQKKKKKKKKSVSAEEDADAVPKENVVADDTTSLTQDPESRFSACLPCGSKPLTRVKRSDGLFPCHEYDQNGTVRTSIHAFCFVSLLLRSYCTRVFGCHFAV
jgi:hypothetical protein